MCLVGYQDSASTPGGGYFILRNSWGTTNWAYQSPYGGGYGTIPYQYIANEAWEAYSAVVPVVADEPGDLSGEHVRGEGKKATVTIQAGSNVTVTIESQ